MDSRVERYVGLIPKQVEEAIRLYVEIPYDDDLVHRLDGARYFCKLQSAINYAEAERAISKGLANELRREFLK